MSEDYANEEQRQFLRRVAAFRGKFDLTSLSLPELVQRQKIVSKKLIDEDFISKNKRELLKIARCALAREIHQRLIYKKRKQTGPWE